MGTPSPFWLLLTKTHLEVGVQNIGWTLCTSSECRCCSQSDLAHPQGLKMWDWSDQFFSDCFEHFRLADDLKNWLTPIHKNFHLILAHLAHLIELAFLVSAESVEKSWMMWWKFGIFWKSGFLNQYVDDWGGAADDYVNILMKMLTNLNHLQISPKGMLAGLFSSGFSLSPSPA